MKKLVLALFMTALLAGGAFAQISMSAGGGLYLTGDFGGGYEYSIMGYKTTMKTPYFGAGPLAFFDATYVEAYMGLFFAGGKWESVTDIPAGYGNAGFEGDASGTGFDIGALAKFPISMGDKMTLFPLLGIAYRAMLAVKVDDSDWDDPGDFSALWFRFGGGLDYFLTDKMFLRGELLYGIRTKNTFEDDFDDDARLGHGLEIKILFGYRFK